VNIRTVNKTVTKNLRQNSLWVS